MMREPWTATVHHGALLNFQNEDKTICSVKGLLEEIVIGRKGILEASPRQFEEIAYAYFRNTIDGSVELTIQTRDGGYDLLCIDSKIGSFIVEAKRYSNKIDISIVRELLGVMVYNDIKRGIVFHSSALTRDAEQFVTKLRDKGEWNIEPRNVEDIMAWLRLTYSDFDPVYLWNHIKSLSLNGDDFAIPLGFFTNPSAYTK
ncbi:restriction endonuclease [candidate division KSB1 bacterium]|nr:restriction endonuclease [candidate division KSB1 bacterium]